MSPTNIDERQLEQQAAAALRAAGFPFVQIDVLLPGLGKKRGMQADVVAWDVTEEGELRPRILVETKQAFGARFQLKHGTPSAGVLQQLAGYANVLGTRENYVFDETGWHEVGPGFDEIIGTQRPEPWGNELRGEWPANLVNQLVVSALWKAADSVRGEAPREELGWRSLRRLLNRAVHGDGTETGLDALLSSKAGSAAVLRALLENGLPKFRGPHSYETPWPLADAMSRLAAPRDGDTVLDPFCGVGTCLWNIASHAADLSLRGVDLDEATAELARSLADFGRLRAEILTQDSLAERDHAPADVLITSPPLGYKLPSPLKLTAGGQTRDGDFAILDRVPGWLKPGGRAVLLMAPGTLFRSQGVRVRAHVQDQLRVVAVVGLPAGILAPATMIPLSLIVLEKRAESETLVARLGDDWEDQLSRGGEFFRAYLAHLIDPS